MKTGLAIQKITKACLQNEPIIGSLSHSIKFFRKYCDNLAEIFKSVFVCNIIMVGLFYFNFFKILLFEWPTFSMTYFHGFFKNVLDGPTLSTMLYRAKLARFTGGAAVPKLCECPVLSTAIHCCPRMSTDVQC